MDAVLLFIGVCLLVVAIPACIVFMSVKLTLPKIGWAKGAVMFVFIAWIFSLLLPAGIAAFLSLVIVAFAWNKGRPEATTGTSDASVHSSKNPWNSEQ